MNTYGTGWPQTNAFGSTSGSFGVNNAGTGFGSANPNGTGSTFSQNQNYQKGKVEIKLKDPIACDSISDISINRDKIAISTWNNQLYIFEKNKTTTTSYVHQSTEPFKAIVSIDNPYDDFLGISRCALGDNALFFATISGYIKSTDRLTDKVKDDDIGTHSHLITGLKIFNNSHIASCSLDGKVCIWDIRHGANNRLCLLHECGSEERCIGLNVTQNSICVATDKFKVHRFDIRSPSAPSGVEKSTMLAISDNTTKEGQMITCFSITRANPLKYIIGTGGGCLEIFKDNIKNKKTHFYPNQSNTKAVEPIDAVAICRDYALVGCKVGGATTVSEKHYAVVRFDLKNEPRFLSFKDPAPHKFQDPITALQLEEDGKGYYVATGYNKAFFSNKKEIPKLYYVSGYT
ncbi:hypothetical protein GPJ56_010564 [Histomonas meleagridis]|uniref:uncharacterized protein n=1 Tax=Histomonas meleagridis TaxID=135588 RepID=UPI00355A23F9|nr:hypothetical protein GPJ56_010564 [Histomonas meleagridis]KAH0797978.1 hypothetical protein GO595_009197 [Histomonas meleagridis]